VQRALDNRSVTPVSLHMIEGIYSQDGNGFGAGPHEPLGPHGVTSRDYLTNIVIFGKNPLRVDIIAHFLAGHEPGNFGLFHIGLERGMSDVLDPQDIPLFEWKNGMANAAKLEDFARTPLATRFLRRDYNGQNEPEYHLCNEPFNYSAFRNVKKDAACAPEIQFIGKDGRDRLIFDVAMRRDENIRVDILDSGWKTVDCLLDGRRGKGNHQEIWDALVPPGKYFVRLRGEGWRETKKIVIV